MRIVFRVDATPQIGYGHIFRCITLAQCFCYLGFDVVFLGRLQGKIISDKIQAMGGQLLLLEEKDYRKNISEVFNIAEQNEDAKITTEMVCSIFKEDIDLIIVDHYGLDIAWEQAVSELAEKIMVIDDLANRKHNCHYLLDSTPGREVNAYQHLVNTDCMLLVGEQYIPLHPKFYIAKVQQHLQPIDQVKRVAISLGGGNNQALVKKILSVFESFNEDYIIDIIIGFSSSPHDFKGFEHGFKTGNSKLHFYYNQTNIIPILLKADVVIGAAGTSLWERACLGIPSIVLQTADNQKHNIAIVSKAQVGLVMEYTDQNNRETLSETIYSAINKPEKLFAFAHKAFKFIDGLGLSRILIKLLPEYNYQNKMITLRQATTDKDMKQLYRWQSLPETRLFFHNPDVPSWEQHQQWFKNKLNDVNCMMWLIMYDQIAVGMLRLDRETEFHKLYTVSILIDPNYKRLGIAKSALFMVQKVLFFMDYKASVHEANTASKALFKSAGFEFKDDDFYYHSNYWQQNE